MIGDALAACRRRQRIKQREVCQKVGISISYYSQIENNTRKCNYKRLIAICNRLHTSLSVILLESREFTEEEKRMFIDTKPLIDKILSALTD